MTYYVLQAHARDVNISENIGDIGRHTGFDLITYEGDNISNIYSLDLDVIGGKMKLHRLTPVVSF